MALNQRTITRWFWAALSFALITLRAFLNVKEGDDVLTTGKKAADAAARRVMYFFADWGLTAASAAIVGGMKSLDFSFLAAFAALWLFDFVTAGCFLVFYEKTGKDLSLGEDFRRAADAATERSRLMGYVVFLPVIAKAVFWTGPERVIIFFRREIRTTPRIILVLFVLTAIQAGIWTVVYGFGWYTLLGGSTAGGSM